MVRPDALRTLSREQVRDVDRRAVEEYGMSSLVLMENAGRSLADLLAGLGVGHGVLVCCGKGNNAGDGFVAARHLDIRGIRVGVALWGDPDELSPDAAANYRIARRGGLAIEVFKDGHDSGRLADLLTHSAWAVDALLGTGARGAPRPPYDRVIEELNASHCQTLAVDVPSGLDCDSGEPSEPTIRAAHTCTFVAAKPGFLREPAAPYIGQLHVADIGVPRQLLEEVFAAAESGSSNR